MAVGDGRQIKALTDSWIPRLASGCSSLQNSNQHVIMVKDLNDSSGVWDVDKVRNIFPSFEADFILDIPLVRRNIHDIRYWKWEKHGNTQSKQVIFSKWAALILQNHNLQIQYIFGGIVFLEPSNPS